MAPSIALSQVFDGYSESTLFDRGWRLFSKRFLESGVIIQVGQELNIRHELTQDAILASLLPVFFGLPILTFLIWFGVGQGLGALKQIAAEIEQREAADLSPIELRKVPAEVEPLVQALNEMLQRIDILLENEKRFTADAAHELRTPLSGLKTQAQVALRSVEPATQQHALRQLLIGIDRAGRLVDQLLTLARVDQEEMEPMGESSADLVEITKEVLSDSVVSRSGRRIGLDVIGDIPLVRVNRDALAIVVRNLIDNAIRYTSENGSVEVVIKELSTHIELLISDDGPGISEEDRARVFERFTRLAGQEAHGSGLGLSIVKRIVDMQQAEIVLEDQPDGTTGLVVRLRFYPA